MLNIFSSQSRPKPQNIAALMIFAIPELKKTQDIFRMSQKKIKTG
jgi:hypothetical protein